MTADTAATRGSLRRGNPMVIIRALHVVLWLLVVSGPATALVIAARVSAMNNQLNEVATRPAFEPSRDTASAEGFAELFVAAYLAGDQGDPADPRALVDGFTRDHTVDNSWSPTRTASLGAREISPGYFAVTVAVQIIAGTSGDEEAPPPTPVETQFYSVGVAETSKGWAITALPSLVAAPVALVAPELLVDRLEGLSEEPGLEGLLAGFFSAYLVGANELTRFTSPSTEIAPVKPAPFVQVEVVAAGVATTDGVTHVAAAIRATDSAERVQVLEYALIVSQRDGRWEVSDLLPAPPLATTETN